MLTMDNAERSFALAPKNCETVLAMACDTVHDMSGERVRRTIKLFSVNCRQFRVSLTDVVDNTDIVSFHGGRCYNVLKSAVSEYNEAIRTLARRKVA